MPKVSQRPVWPQSLVERIAAQDYVLFVGAGVSATAVNAAGSSPPTWRALIESLNDRFVESGAQRRRVNALIRAGAYLAAAEQVAYHCQKMGHATDFREAVVLAADGPPNDHFVGGVVHDVLADLNPRLIVTTNYDRILERKFQSGYRVKHYGDSDVAAEIRNGHAVMLKLHGTVDAPAKTILTRSDFTRLRREGAHAIETMQALLLTRVVLFVGYSLGDPDLQLMLENLFGVQGQDAGHFLLSSNTLPEADRATLRDVYGVHPLLYGGGVSGFEGSLRILADASAASRVSV